MPLFSVVIPTCHRNDLLALCLEKLSPNVQNINDYEVIVTDDGTNSTAERLVKEQFPWATWVQGPRMGPAANRNNGASKSRGEWLVFIDDDCIPEVDLLQHYQKAILNHKAIWIFEGRTICKQGITSPLYQAPVNTTGGYLWSCNMAIKNSYFHHIHGFETHFPYPNMEDVHFKDKIVADGKTILFVPEATVDHPPRRMPIPKKQALMHESWYMYWAEKGRKNIRYHLLVEIIKFRVGAIKSRPLSKDSFTAFLWMFEELMRTWVSSFSWSYHK